MFNTLRVLTVFALLCSAIQFCKADEPIANKEAETIAKLVDQLAGKLANRDRAAGNIEDLSWDDLPLLREQAKRDDLSGDQKRRLDRVLARMEARVKLADFHKKVNSPAYIWRAKVAAEYYEKNHYTNPKWDENARLVFKLDGIDRTNISDAAWWARNAQMLKAIDAAVAAGCDDPDFLCAAGVFKADSKGSEAEGFAMIRRALADAMRGKMSPALGEIVIGRVLRARAQGQDGGIDYKNYEPTGNMLCDMRERYLQAARRDDVPPEAVITMAENVLKTANAIHCQITPLLKDVLPPLEKAAPNNAQALIVKAQAFIWAAWEARGGDVAANVTQQGWKDFSADLDVANEALRHAWELDPGDPDGPTKMLTVALGEDWPRAEVEKWYQRAMAADPDDKDAVSSMLWYLQPRWHGSFEEMVQFGRECFETRNWHGDIAFELATAHITVADEFPDASWYYHHQVVWADIAAVYNAYLDLYPANQYVRSAKARYACLCGQWKEAGKLFTELGDKVDVGPFVNAGELKQMKQQVAEHVPNDHATTQP